MPRRKNAVKSKPSKPVECNAPGAVDLHFHGAFGIDLMSAGLTELDRLAALLAARGIAAFCPTTLSVGAPTLRETVRRLGLWIRGFDPKSKGALPLGIHLEGPFISSHACGAHPPGTIRPLTWDELETLWDESSQTLKILTIAPETLAAGDLPKLARWARTRKVHLSLGHSKASEIEAKIAFDGGFRGVTHAWNALGFHHREAGVLGAAFGRKDVFLEMIVDRVHVCPTVIGWTRELHPPDRICFVSDCVPAAATREDEGPFSFGPLSIRFAEGASRLPNGSLAGGGLLLPESLARWIAAEAARTGQPSGRIFRESLVHVTQAPLQALGIHPKSLGRRRYRWRWNERSERLDVSPA